MRPRTALRGLVAFCCLVAASVELRAASNEESEPKQGSSPKLKGRISAGFKVEEFKNGDSDYEAEVDLETKRRRGVRGVASFKGRGDDPGVILEEGYVDAKLESGGRIYFGQTKKILGREYEDGHRKRLTVSRSPLYSKLETFAYVGDELTLRYRSPEPNGAGSQYTLAAGYAESLDYDVTGSFEHLSANRTFNSGVWVLAQADRIDAGRQFVFTTIGSLWGKSGDHRWETELVYGKDPLASAFEKSFGDGKSIYFYGAKAQYGLRFGDVEEHVEPLVQTSWIVHQQDRPGFNTLQVLVGANYVLEDLRLAANVDIVGTTSEMKPEDRTYNESAVRVEATFYF